MATTVTTKGQVTIPKKVREALNIHPGSEVEFGVNQAGEIVLRNAGKPSGRAKKDRFDKVRDSAQIKWRTDDLMELLRR